MLKITLAGSVPLFLSGIAQVFRQHPQCHSVTTCIIWAELETHLAKAPCDLLLLDLSTQQKNAISCCRRILKKYPKLKLIILDKSDQQKDIRAWFKLGVIGYANPSLTAEEAIEALETIIRGQHYLPRSLRSKMADDIMGFKSNRKNGFPLTPREKEVLQLIVAEFTTREIAAKLFISPCTAETHRINIIQKLGVKNTAGIVREAVLNELYA